MSNSTALEATTSTTASKPTIQLSTDDIDDILDEFYFLPEQLHSATKDADEEFYDYYRDSDEGIMRQDIDIVVTVATPVTPMTPSTPGTFSTPRTSKTEDTESQKDHEWGQPERGRPLSLKVVGIRTGKR